MTAMRNAFRVGVVLWAGSLWSLALWVAPTLFFAQSDRRLAGMLAGRLFSVETWLALGVAGAAILQPGRLKYVYLYLAAAILALNEWGLRQVMELAHTAGRAWGLSFGAWHGVSALFYGIACLATLALIWKNDFR